MSFRHEMKRLRADYPHLKPRFESRGKCWVCELLAQTTLFGLYGISAGEGATRKEALLTARFHIDNAVANEQRAKVRAKEEAKEAARKAKRVESDLDDEVFAMFGLPLHDGTQGSV